MCDCHPRQPTQWHPRTAHIVFSARRLLKRLPVWEEPRAGCPIPCPSLLLLGSPLERDTEGIPLCVRAWRWMVVNFLIWLKDLLYWKFSLWKLWLKGFTVCSVDTFNNSNKMSEFQPVVVVDGMYDSIIKLSWFKRLQRNKRNRKRERERNGKTSETIKLGHRFGFPKLKHNSNMEYHLWMWYCASKSRLVYHFMSFNGLFHLEWLK